MGSENLAIRGIIKVNYILFLILNKQINWPMINSDRIDIIYNPEPLVRESISQTEQMNVLPIDEGCIIRWNDDPWQLDCSDNDNPTRGYMEYESSGYLTPYWALRYYEYIV